MKFSNLLVPFVAIAIYGCAGRNSGLSSGGGTTPATVVQMTGNHTFNPTMVTVAAGSTVQWKNTDTTHHTVASDTGVANFNSDGQFAAGLPGGSTFNFTIPAGTPSGTVFFYHCEFHGAAGDGTHLGTGMAGSVTVQ
jgi:plastocyanin